MQHWSDIFPLIFFPFKIIVLGIGAYFAIKWHYDEDNRLRKKREDQERVAAAREEVGAVEDVPRS
ncbi:MAG: hypothetical protein AAGF13_01735 [Pseudomonadota bacterium]